MANWPADKVVWVTCGCMIVTWWSHDLWRQQHPWRLCGYVPMIFLAPIQDAMKGNLDTWLGIVRADWGCLRNLVEWGWSECNAGGIALKSGDLALGTDHDTLCIHIMWPPTCVITLTMPLLLTLHPWSHWYYLNSHFSTKASSSCRYPTCSNLK